MIVKKTLTNSPINGEARSPENPVNDCPFQVTVPAPKKANVPIRIEKGPRNESKPSNIIL